MITGSAIGNMTEWFDYGAYGYVADQITRAFFPGAGFVGTALVFAVSFVLRPLGGMFWGPLGDRIGRQRVLALRLTDVRVGSHAVEQVLHLVGDAVTKALAGQHADQLRPGTGACRQQPQTHVHGLFPRSAGLLLPVHGVRSRRGRAVRTPR